jgi:hypothetical protein
MSNKFYFLSRNSHYGAYGTQRTLKLFTKRRMWSNYLHAPQGIFQGNHSFGYYSDLCLCIHSKLAQKEEKKTFIKIYVLNKTHGQPTTDSRLTINFKILGCRIIFIRFRAFWAAKRAPCEALIFNSLNIDTGIPPSFKKQRAVSKLTLQDIN